mgnify:CR=1 FL=1
MKISILDMVINKIIYFKIYLIIFLFFSTSLSFSQENLLNTEKFLKPHCSNETNFQKKSILEKLEIKVDNNRNWSRNLLNLHYYFQNEKGKSKNKNWFENFRIDNKYKKKFPAKILVKHNGFEPCIFNAKIRITGDLWWHIGWAKGTPVSSLHVELLNGHINNITKFKLFLPEARYNENEVFVAVFLKHLGFLSPRTFLIESKVNGFKGKYIFQEDLRKEFLEHSFFREGPILEGDERFTIMLKDSENIFDQKSNLSKLVNKKFAKKNIYNSYVGLDAVSNMNILYLQNHKFQAENKFLTDDLYLFTEHLFNDKINVELLETFESLMFALDAVHGLSFDDRRFYFDSIDRSFLPIFYDGKSKILNSKQKIGFDGLEQNVSIEAKNGSKKAIEKILKVDKISILHDLKTSGLTIDKEKLNFTINKILKRLEIIASSKSINLQISEKDKYFSTLSKKDSQKKKLVFTNFNLREFYVCDYKKLNCTTLKNNLVEYKKNLPEAISQNFEFLKEQFDKNDQFIFVFKDLEYEKSKMFYSKELSNWNSELVENSFVQYNESIELEIDKIQRIIKITQIDPNGIILFKNGELENWKIIFHGYKKDKILKKTYDLSPMNLTGCINIYKAKLINVSFEVRDTYCEDALNIIKSNGEVKNIIVHNSFSDGLDIDFSNISIEKIEISNSGNDCVDFSSGNYNLKKLNLKHCGDKALSVGEKSFVKLEEINADNASIGIASKDSSVVKLENANLDSLNTCIAAYNKKQEYDGGIVEIDNLSCSNFNERIKIDFYSKVLEKNKLVKNIK